MVGNNREDAVTLEFYLESAESGTEPLGDRSTPLNTARWVPHRANG